MQWTCPASLTHSIPPPANCNGPGGRRRARAIRRSRPGPNETASGHGGGMTWMPGTYDPELNLLYWPTGNTNPVFAGQGRPGANLWTESIVALDADTGKLKWYFQVSPHDTHDFDNTTAPILFDARGGRQAAKAACAGRAQRLLRDPRPGDRQTSAGETVCAAGLFVGPLAAGRAHSDPGQGSHRSAGPSIS